MILMADMITSALSNVSMSKTTRLVKLNLWDFTSSLIISITVVIGADIMYHTIHATPIPTITVVIIALILYLLLLVCM